MRTALQIANRWQTRALDAAFAPLHWLERARGRRRLALLFLYLIIFMIVGVLTWRATSLKELPDIGEPFDRREFARVDVPDDQNAWKLYEKALAKHFFLKENEKPLQKGFDWAKSHPLIHAWVDKNQAALALWVEGSKRPDMLVFQPSEFSFDTRLEWIQGMRDLARLGALERSRRQLAGDIDGAWEMNRALLRSSRHVGKRGVLIQRLVAAAFLSMAADGINQWADDPKTSVAKLREAIAEVEEARRLTPPISQAIKLEYMTFMKALDDAEATAFKMSPEGFEDKTWWYTYLPGYHRAHVFLLREPERSRRVARLTTANILRYCDLPPDRRPGVFGGKDILFYDEDSSTLPTERRIDARTLERFAISTLYFRAMYPAMALGTRSYDRERGIFGSLLIGLAEQCYRREHAGKLPKTLGELVGPYLKRLPDGFDPSDASIGETEKSVKR